MNQTEIVQLLTTLKKEIRQQYKAQIKGIFGSVARGEAQPDSDLDILVEFDEGATLLDLAGLGNYLEDLLHQKVDILSQRAVRDEIKDTIYSDLVPV